MTNPARLKEKERKSIRFPIIKEARLRAESLDAPGTTVNVSSGGAVLKTSARVRQGTSVEAHLKWPAIRYCTLDTDSPHQYHHHE